MAAGTGLPSLADIRLDGVDVKSYVIALTCKKSARNTISTLSMSISAKASSLLTIDKTLIGADVTFKRGVSSSTEHFIFEGEVTAVRQEGTVYVIDAKDRLFRLWKKVVSNVYNSSDEFLGKPNLIYEDLCSRAGVPYSSTYIIDPGSSYILNQFWCDDAYAGERAEKLLIAPGWRHWYDPSVSSARYEQKAYTPSGVTLAVGDNVVNNPRFSNDADSLIQVLTVRGGVQSAETTETFSGTGSTDTFTLSYIPETVRVENPSGTEKVQGINGVTTSGSYDYYVDKLNKKVIFVTSTTAGANNVDIKYTYLIERPVVVSDGASIAAYSTDGSGNEYPYEKVIHSEDQLNVSDVRNMAEGIIGEKSQVVPSTSLNVRNVYGLEPNMSVVVEDYRNSLSITAYIEDIEYRYPYNYDVVGINRMPTNPMDLLSSLADSTKKLYEAISKGEKAVLVIKPVGRSVKAWRRVFTKKSRQWDSSNSGFILDHGKYGILGTSELDATTADSGFNSWVIDERIPADGVWEEFVKDNTYYDSTNSTGTTFDTTTETITIATGTYYSELIAKGRSYTNVKVDLGTASGALTIEISADNKSTWQTITEATTTTLTNSDGTGVYLRITASGTKTIQNTKNTPGHYTEAAIKVTLS